MSGERGERGRAVAGNRHKIEEAGFQTGFKHVLVMRRPNGKGKSRRNRSEDEGREGLRTS